MRKVLVFAGIVYGIEFRTKISHWNTGQLFAYELTEWETPRIGPVCSVSKDWEIGDVFASAACQGLLILLAKFSTDFLENGFDGHEFIGSREEYIEFVRKSNKEIQVRVQHLI